MLGRRVRSGLRAARLRAAAAAHRRRRRRVVTAGAAGNAATPAAGRGLVPILVDSLGRDGSTLTMRLLASSPQIATEPRHTHDLRSFELRYFAYMWEWARLLDADEWPRDRWGDRSVATLLERPTGLVGPPLWMPRGLFEPGADGTPISRRAFELVWGELSARAALQVEIERGTPASQVRYYAEKHRNSWRLDLSTLPELHLVVLLRDPRDVLASMEGFNRMRGDSGFGRQRGLSDEQYVDLLISRHRERLRWVAEVLRDDRWPVLRFDELVGDLPGVAGRLERRLGIELDPDAVLADRSMRSAHVSAASPQAAVGRWRQDLAPEVAERIAAGLAPELRDVGL